MQQELRLHGHVDDAIEFYATVAAHDAECCHFYERDGETLRIFSPGNEMRLDREGLSHWGNGGTFCEYMHGIDCPLADLLKPEVRNRLIFFGASYRDNGELVFSDATMGHLSYREIFEAGHAISNCFFFVTGSVYGALQTQQEGLLFLLGKVLKRTARVSEADDARLVDELFSLLGHRSHLYLVRLINKKHKAYHDLFRKLYFTYRSIPDDEYDNLKALANRLGIEEHQQQRIRIAVMYAQRENKLVVDEYRAILTSCHHKGTITRQENARLTRLKTLATRNKIPAALFEPLDDYLKYEKMVDREQEYIASTREILSSLLYESQTFDSSISSEDMVRLLFAKKQAMQNRDYLFDQILLETSKTCDERVHNGADVALLERMNTIIDYFDHYESSAMEINNLAFMVGVRIDEQMLYIIRRSYKALERLQKNLFNQLLFDDLLKDRFLGTFGRKKIEYLRNALDAGQPMTQLYNGLRTISENESMYSLMLDALKEHLRSKHARSMHWREQRCLSHEIEMLLQRRGVRCTPFPEGLFHEVLINLEKELFYLQELLPEIITNADADMREDFLLNSGLDRFYVEELERDYLQRNGLGTDLLDNLKK